MRKLLVVGMAAITLVLTGCSGSEEVKETPKDVAVEQKQTKEDALFRYSSLIPDSKEMFEGTDIKVIDQDGGKNYKFRITNFKEEYFPDYVYELKKRDFVEVRLETADIFEAYITGGKYHVRVDFEPTDNTALVAVTKSKNYKGE